MPSPYISRINKKTFDVKDCGEVNSVNLDFNDDVCHILLNFKNGFSFEFDAGLKDFAYTDCQKTHVVSLQPEDGAICVATGYWQTLNEFNVTARMVPTHAMFNISFKFENGGVSVNIKYARAYEFGTRQ